MHQCITIIPTSLFVFIFSTKSIPKSVCESFLQSYITCVIVSDVHYAIQICLEKKCGVFSHLIKNTELLIKWMTVEVH